MRYEDGTKRLREVRGRIAELREELREVQSKIEPAEVQDYKLTTAEGNPVQLSELFGNREHLFVVHNMGRGCPYCTLWADGFSGVIDHLENRAAFVVSTPDSPETQSKFAESRGWRFRMVSHEGTSFASDMGYRRDDRWWPGVSVFQRDGDRIVRVSDTEFGPGDDFCSVFHLLELLPEGSEGWQPKFKY